MDIKIWFSTLRLLIVSGHVETSEIKQIKVVNSEIQGELAMTIGTLPLL